MTKKEQLKQKENEFYSLQDTYKTTDDPSIKKQCWDKMFLLMLDAVTAAIKTKLRDVMRTDIDELALDATCQVMNRYINIENYTVQYLLATARFAAIGVLYNEKQKFYDRLLSLDKWESLQYAKENNMENRRRK